MKAWMSHLPGGPESLELQEVADPFPAANELVVRVHAVGVNYPDALLIRDQYQVKPPRPFSPGAEFSGIVEFVGPGVTKLQVGDAVIGRCGWGGLAEKICIEESRCVRLPPGMGMDEAAGFLFVYATAYHALRDVAELRAGETLLVLGAAGGVGSAAIDLGQALGARVVVTASSQEKVDHALAKGAVKGAVYPADLSGDDNRRALSAVLKDLVGPGGAHVVFDPVGGAYSEAALRTLGVGGRHLVVGFAAGIPRLPLNLVLLKRCKVLGVDWRGFLLSDPSANDRNVQSLFALWREQAIRPGGVKAFAFEDAVMAIQTVEQRQAVGKVVVQGRGRWG